MALSKFSRILLLGILAAVFIPGKLRYIAFFLPTFWATEGILGVNPFIDILIAFLMAVVYTYFFIKAL